MKYEAWNNLIKSYFFNDDHSSDIYLSIDKESFIDYILSSGILDESIKKVQDFQRKEGRPVVTPRDYAWSDFLRLFGLRGSNKSSFISKLREQISLLDSEDLYLLFPYFALFTMPLANSPEMHARNYYTRLTEFLRSNCLIGKNEIMSTADMASISSPSLQQIWKSLESWAINHGYNYQVKYTFRTERNDYVAPFLAECLFTAARKEKFKILFYKAGLAPNNDMTAENAMSIMQLYHRDIDFDDSKWRDAKDKFKQLLISTFIKEYNKWDGTTNVIKKEGGIRRQVYAGTRQSLLLRVSSYRGNFEFGLLASLPDASNAEDFDYQSTQYGNYSFVINNRIASSEIWNPSISAAIGSFTAVSFKRLGHSDIELVYQPKECELLRADRHGYIATTELVPGSSCAVLLKNSVEDRFKPWLNENGAVKVCSHELTSSHSLYEIKQVVTEFPDDSVRKLTFTKFKSARLASAIRIPCTENAVGIYYGVETFFEVKGIDVSHDTPKAVFNTEGTVEIVDLRYDKDTGLWALPIITNKITRSKAFQIYCNNERLTRERYLLVDFKILEDSQYQEITFNKFGEYDELGSLKGLEMDDSRAVNYQNLESSMKREGEHRPQDRDKYNAKDYLLYMLSTMPRVSKSSFEEAIEAQQALGLFEFKEENKWAIREVLNNYFRLGYINYAYYNSEHIIAVNKPTLILLPPRCEKIKMDGLTRYIQRDSYWTAILTGARTPSFMDRVFRHAINIKGLSWRILPSNDGVMPETILFMADSLDNLETLSSSMNIRFSKDIYSNALLMKIATVEEYHQHAKRNVSNDYYDAISNYETLNYQIMSESTKYCKAKSFDKKAAVVTYFPGSYRAQTILWDNEIQYKVDKHWGHLLGMRLSGFSSVRYDDTSASINLPRAIQLPVLYARALTMITGLIPTINGQLRAYSVYDNPYTRFVSIDVILKKLG